MKPPIRLLVLVNVYRPDLGGGVLFADLCEGLRARGFDVTVRCAVPYYPEWTDKDGLNGLAIHRSRSAGVTVERHGLYIPTRPDSVAQRLLHEASFAASLARRLPAPYEYDAVMVFCPLMGTVAWGAVLSALCGLPLWLNVQDLSADAAAESGIVKGAVAARALAAVQGILFNYAHAWSTISPVMAERLATIRRRGQPIHVLPNWLHASLAALLPGPAPARVPGSPPRLLYSGNIGAKQDLLRLCETLAASDAAFSFVIRGSGGRAAEVVRWIRERDDPRFEFRPLTDEAGLAEAIRTCDLFVITETERAGGSFIPSKMLPALASGRPILAVCEPRTPFGREMAESGAGPAFRSADIGEVPALLKNLPDRPDVLEAWRDAAVRRSALYDRERTIDRYARLLNDLVSGSCRST